MKAKVQVVGGDIARQDTDAIMTAINSAGAWFGGIDGVIQRAAGNHFHKQAASASPLEDGQTVVAKGKPGCSIKNVVFVVDDLQRPLSEIVQAGLIAADEAGYRSVAVPTIRMGVMLGQVEKTDDEAYDQMHQGVQNFLSSGPECLEEIRFVVYDDTEMEAALRVKLGLG